MTSDFRCIEEREEFISAIYDHTLGVLEIRPLPPDRKPFKPVFTSDLSVALREVEIAERGGANVYIGIAARKPGVTHGTKANLGGCRALWIDFDFGEDVAQDAIRFQTALDSFPVVPSILVDSGGGRHAYWLLREPLDLQQAADREWHEAALRGLAKAWGSDRAVTDSSRIMRVPGTMNFPNAKKREAGRTNRVSQILERVENAIYERERFAEWVALGQKPQTIIESKVREDGWPDAVRDALRRRESLRRLFSYTPQSGAGWVKPTGEPNFSLFDDIIARELIEEGVLRKDIQAACLRLRLENGGDHPKIHGDEYWQRTFEHAYSMAKPHARRERWWFEDHPGCQLRRWILTDGLVNGEDELPTPGFKRTPGIEVGISEIDSATGGMYGFTVLSGREGGGKTMLALMAAVSASLQGIRVLYLNAETHVNVLAERVRRQLGVSFDDAMKLTKTLHWIRLRRSVDDPVAFLKQQIVSRITDSDERVLVIFDSLSSITRKLIPAGSRDFWRDSQRLEEWLVDCRTVSSGAVTFVAISELNKEGIEKGMTSAYAADMVIRVEKDKKEGVKLRVHKSRETGAPDDVIVTLNAERMRFETSSLAAELGERARSEDGKVIEMRPSGSRRGNDLYTDF